MSIDDIPREALMNHRFQRIRRLGDGAFGQAILVFDQEDGQRRVVKRLKGKLRRAELKSALNEAKTLSRLHHPGIVDFYKIWIEGDGHLHFLMEYCDSGDLQQFLDSHRTPLTETTLRSFLFQLLHAVAYMHSNHVIHRDIKLPNIFLSHSHAVLKIGDFGLSKLINSTDEAAKTQAGTPYYFSPEIADGRHHTRKTDIWSLGVLMYQLMTKELPFRGKGIGAILDNIRRGHPEPVGDVAAAKHAMNYSSELCATVMVMLTKDPASRPSAAELLQQPWIQSTPPPQENWTPSHVDLRCFSPAGNIAINIRLGPSFDASVVGRLNRMDLVNVVADARDDSNVMWLQLCSPVAGWCIAELDACSLFRIVPPQNQPSPRQSPHQKALKALPSPRRQNLSPSPRANGAVKSPCRSPHYASPVKRRHVSPTGNPRV